MKKFTIKKRSLVNLGYACAVFFYVDLFILTAVCLGGQAIETYQLKRDASEILQTPDLTSGLEELERAVELDLAAMEKRFKKNS